jgi:hypothetical protein
VARVSPAGGQRNAKAREVQTLLDAARQEWREAVHQHGVQGEARFREIGRLVRAQKGGARLRQLRQMEEFLRGVHFKPRKGRVRDLRRADRLLKELLAILER